MQTRPLFEWKVEKSDSCQFVQQGVQLTRSKTTFVTLSPAIAFLCKPLEQFLIVHATSTHIHTEEVKEKRVFTRSEKISLSSFPQSLLLAVFLSVRLPKALINGPL